MFMLTLSRLHVALSFMEYIIKRATDVDSRLRIN